MVAYSRVSTVRPAAALPWLLASVLLALAFASQLGRLPTCGIVSPSLDTLSHREEATDRRHLRKRSSGLRVSDLVFPLGRHAEPRDRGDLVRGGSSVGRRDRGGAPRGAPRRDARHLQGDEIRVITPSTRQTCG